MTEVRQINIPTLTSFPELMQLQFSPEIREQMFPYIEVVSITVPHTPPSPAGCACPIGKSASALKCYLELGCEVAFCLQFPCCRNDPTGQINQKIFMLMLNISSENLKKNSKKITRGQRATAKYFTLLICLFLLNSETNLL